MKIIQRTRFARSGLCALFLVCVLPAALRAESGDDLDQAYQAAQEAMAAPKGPAVPSVPGAAEDPDVRQGLRLLFKNVKCSDPAYCLNAQTEDAMAANALAFHRKLQDLIGAAPEPRVAWKKTGYSVSEFEFDSLVKRAGGHPADKVRGLVFFPNSYKACDVSFPATLLIHKLGDSLDSEIQIAKFAASSDRGVVMLIYLPHFGPRKGSEAFITKVPEDFELNILQSLADIHQSYRVLRSLPKVKPDDVGLMGLSLGGMITLISAGLDPVFDRYATNVGGGDLANIVTYRKSGDVDSRTGQALKEIDWSVDQARFFLSRFDAVTWSLKVKGKSILMINAENDELVSKPLSLDPLIEGYGLAGSKVRSIRHKGTHVFRAKEVGYLDTLTKVMLPMIDFVGPNNYDVQTCRENR
jgi:hypothetical protein